LTEIDETLLDIIVVWQTYGELKLDEKKRRNCERERERIRELNNKISMTVLTKQMANQTINNEFKTVHYLLNQRKKLKTPTLPYLPLPFSPHQPCAVTH